MKLTVKGRQRDRRVYQTFYGAYERGKTRRDERMKGRTGRRLGAGRVQGNGGSTDEGGEEEAEA